jgi:hypothetical protein
MKNKSNISTGFQDFVEELLAHRPTFHKEPDSLAHFLVKRCETFGKVHIKGFVQNLLTTPTGTLQYILYPLRAERRKDIEELKELLLVMRERIQAQKVLMVEVELAFLRFVFNLPSLGKEKKPKRAKVLPYTLAEETLPVGIQVIRPLNIALMLIMAGYLVWRSTVALAYGSASDQFLYGSMAIGIFLIITLFYKFAKRTLTVIFLLIVFYAIMGYVIQGEYKTLSKEITMNGKLKQLHERLHEIRKALVLYRQIHEEFPNTLSQLTTPVSYVKPGAKGGDPLVDPFKPDGDWLDYKTLNDLYMVRSWGTDGTPSISIERDFDWERAQITLDVPIMIYEPKYGMGSALENKGDIFVHSTNFKMTGTILFILKERTHKPKLPIFQ